MLGACTALELARRGQSVTLVEGADRILDGASRWNEGKIHLGFLYAGDRNLATATRLIPGGLAFTEIVESFVGRSIDSFATDDDVYLVHRDSIVDADTFEAYANRTCDLIRDAARAEGAPRYLTNVQSACAPRLAPSELADLTTNSQVVAGFRTPERSVSTVPIAHLLAGAVHAEPRIDVRTATWVDGVRRRADGRLDIPTTRESGDDLEAFDVVVNALWEGRLAVDASLGLKPPASWSHRFRAAVFAHAPANRLRSVVLCTGPFGDTKCYADGRIYLSWYDAGLVVQGEEVEPPRHGALLTRDRQARVLEQTLASLSAFFPAVGGLSGTVTERDIHGGWVYAVGKGSLADPESLLHRRDAFGITVDRGYISVDTAKYSIAPWLARQVAEIATSS
jgi:glycine/D-amino acid oxidase-like deaminating enzyme